MRKAVSGFLCAVILFSLCSCGGAKKCTYSFTAMDTLMSITIYSADKAEADKLFERIKSEAERLEKSLSVNIKTSDVSLINAADNTATVSKETAALIEKAVSASTLTDGAFDITVFPILALWGFNDGLYGVPDESKIKEALKSVGYKKITLDGTSVIKNGADGISLGGIAKGYLGDLLLNAVNKEGVPAVLSLGGNIVLCGNKPDNDKWSVAVRNPSDESKYLCEFSSDGNLSVVTSGAYERYFEYDGKIYHHIIDSKTGYPVKSDILSVTVIGKDGAMCDAFSTAMFVMGYEKAAAFLKKQSDFEYVILTDDGVIHTSTAFENFTVTDKKNNSLKIDS